MPYYYINLILISTYALIFSNLNLKKGRGEKIFLLVSLIQIVFFRTFVNPQSVPDLSDWNGYVTEFQNIAKDDFNSFWYYLITARYEPLYLVFVKGCSLVSSNYHYYLGLAAFISVFPVISSVNKFSRNKFLSIVLFVLLFFTLSSFVIRQFISVGILLLSYNAIIKKRFFVFLLITIIASLFHYSSILWFFVYFLYWYGNNNRRVMFVFILLVMIILFVSSDIERIIRSFEYYSDYAEEKQSYKMGVIHAFFLFCYVFALGKNATKEGINRIVFISLLLGTIGLVFANYAERLYTCFKYGDLFAIPITFSYLKKKGLGFVYISIALILCVALFVSEKINNSASFLY